MADILKEASTPAVVQPNTPQKAESQIAEEPQKPPSVTFLIAVHVVLCIGLLIALSASYIKQIVTNFGSFRCNPLIMPFAGLFGYNASDNFQFCLNGLLEGRLGEAFSPVFKMLGTFGTTLETVVNAALGLRNVFTNFLITVNGFISSVTQRIKSLMTEVRMSMLKLKELMGKVYGTMYAVIWMGTSGLTAAKNVSENDLVKFMMEFCFAPDTAVQLADGSWKPMESLQIGDSLASLAKEEAKPRDAKPRDAKPRDAKPRDAKPRDAKPRITSLFRFDGSRTPLVQIGDVVVSASHYVSHEGTWMEASDHPKAIPLPSLPVLCCLNVTGHRFLVGRSNLLAADYDEEDDEEVVATTQALAIKTLNGFPTDSVTPVDYSLGLCGEAEVRMEDGTWKRIDAIRIGDVVAQSGIVKGTVQEECTSVVNTPVGPMAAGQLLFTKLQWKRAAHVWKPSEKPCVLYQLVTEYCSALEIRKGGVSLYIRDYREVAVPEMEDAYAAVLKSHSRVADVV